MGGTERGSVLDSFSRNNHYTAVDEQTAFYELDSFAEKWDKKYPKISESWRNVWPQLSTYFKYPSEVRKLIYTTNAIEGFNRQAPEGY